MSSDESELDDYIIKLKSPFNFQIIHQLLLPFSPSLAELDAFHSKKLRPKQEELALFKIGKLMEKSGEINQQDDMVSDLQIKVLSMQSDPVKDTPYEPKQRKPLSQNNLEEVLKPLDNLIGLNSIKQKIRDMLHLQIVQQKRTNAGLNTDHISNHMVFSGNPGTGKTTLARTLAQILYEAGLTQSDKFIETDRSKLVGQYIGQTAQWTAHYLQEALGGVLFIDEAHTLNTGYYDDYGSEAIATIVKFMEDHRDEIVIIFAGYPQEMSWFLDSNPGLHSRIAHHVAFEDYTDEQAILIFEKLCEDKAYVLTDQAKEKLRAGFKNATRDKRAAQGNGRNCRNLFEETLRNQARRIIKKDLEAVQDLQMIMPEDLPFTGITASKSDTVIML